jgi:hypothetical protein
MSAAAAAVMTRSVIDPSTFESLEKFFYLFTCEYCFSHYVTLFFLWLTRYHLLLGDRRGYVIALFTLVWIANIYMGLFALIRVDLKKERKQIENIEQDQ